VLCLNTSKLSVGIVTDSMSDLTPELAELYKIHVVPGIVHINNQPYRSGIDIHREQIYKVIENNTDSIRTAAPSPAAYYSVYKELGNKDIIISLHCPGKLTAVSNAAKTAARRLDDSSKVHHFECGVGTLGLGLTAIATRYSAEKITTKKALLEQVAYCCKNIQIIGTIDSFDYIKRSGRIHLKLATWVADSLDIKPVLNMFDQNVYLEKTLRKREKVVQYLINALKERIDTKLEPNIIGISHFGSDKDALQTEKILSDIEHLTDFEIIKALADPMIAVNTGKGLLLLAFFCKNESTKKLGRKINV
jgi:DegV family protein with EDD domain